MPGRATCRRAACTNVGLGVERIERMRIVAEALRSARRPARATERTQRRRLADLVELARARSPYYRELYAGLPPAVEDPARLPPTSKAELMDRFDDWATDREITLERASAFTADKSLVGASFLGRYLLASSSGTTGLRGLYVWDELSLAVGDALRLRALVRWLGAPGLARLARAGGRTAIVTATHGHFTGAGIARRPGLRRRAVLPLSVIEPVQEMVAELNEFRPAILSGYAGTLAQLAGEREAGRLSASPLLVASSAEGLEPGQVELIERAFGVPHRSTYAAAECTFLGHSCSQGWQHLNADWAIVEPIDSAGGPTPAGELSDGILLTNLANRAQPRIRQRLDDRLLRRPDPCPCGSPLPAHRVVGRSADLIRFEGRRGSLEVSQQTLAMALDGPVGATAFQLVQEGPRSVRLRLAIAPGSDPEQVWARGLGALSAYFERHGVGDVELRRAEEPPQLTAGGKLRKVVPLRGTEPAGVAASEGAGAAESGA